MSDPAPVTVTSTLEAIWADAAEPILLAALNTVLPGISAVFNIPVLGTFLTWLLNGAVNKLIAAGVIDVKIGILNFLSSEVQTKWAAQIQILQQVSAAGATLTPEEQAAYDAALQAIGQNHPGVTNA